jgi:hypothetical protein
MSTVPIRHVLFGGTVPDLEWDDSQIDATRRQGTVNP